MFALQRAADYKEKGLQGYMMSLTKVLELDIKKGWRDRIKETLKEIVLNIDGATIYHHSTIDDLVEQINNCPESLEVEANAAITKVNERRNKMFLDPVN